MQPYNFLDFNKDFNIFKGEHPDIKVSHWVKEDTRWDRDQNKGVPHTYTLGTIRYKGERILQYFTNDPHNIHNRLGNYNANTTTAHALGLITRVNSNIGASTLIDALYYKANPPVYFNKNGTLKKGFYGWLNRRLRSPNINGSWVTQDMLTLAEKLGREFLGDSTATIKQWLVVNHGISEGYYQDAITGKLHVNGSHQRLRISTLGYVYVHNITALNMPVHGYTYNERHGIWLKANEFYHNGHVYDRSEVSIGQCTSCHEEVVTDLLQDGVCVNCLEDSYKIHNYSTRVEGLLKFKATKVKPTTIYLGCELEYETINRQKAQMGVGKLLQGHALMKSDGSIQNGFEIVTCPATLDIHLQVFKSFFDNLPPDLKVEKNVGMHVHISRKPLSQLTLGKMTEFLNRDDNKDFIHNIAGRINNDYARMEKNRTVTYAWKHRNGSDRYNALNLNNPNTVEIRLFATPTDYKTFAMRLQFCQALVDFCQPGQVSAPLKTQTHHKTFIGWLNQNRKAYPELSNHLKGFN